MKREDKIKLFKIVGVIAGAVLIPLLGIFLYNTFRDYEAYIAKQYSLPEDHIYEYLTYKDFKEKVDNGDEFIIVYSDPSCAGCQTNLPALNKKASSLDVDVIYYIENTQKKFVDYMLDNHSITIGSTPSFFYVNGETDEVDIFNYVTGTVYVTEVISFINGYF